MKTTNQKMKEHFHRVDVRNWLDNEFEGRFFAVGSTHTKEIWGTVTTFNLAMDELIADGVNGNGGVCVDIIEVDENGNYIKG